MIRIDQPLPGGATAHVVFTGRADGDHRPGAPGVDQRRRAIARYPWTSLAQVHGRDVVVVDAPGACDGAVADAAVTACAGAVLSIRTADCAPVALLAPADGVLGVAHAGWLGLRDGVLPATVAAMRALGAGELVAVLGPCIRAGEYEFGADDLDAVVAVSGETARGRTRWGAPALDVPAAVRAQLEAAGVREVVDLGVCTAADDAWFSHRARHDDGRQVLAAWLEPGGSR